MPVIEKAKIIETIQQTDDERVLLAITDLLERKEEEIPQWHKTELDKRTQMRKNGEMEIYNWDDVKDEIKSATDGLGNQDSKPRKRGHKRYQEMV